MDVGIIINPVAAMFSVICVIPTIYRLLTKKHVPK